jgi:predicted transcriptional regulator
MMPVKDEPIRVFEKQSGLIRLLIHILTEGPTNVQKVIDTTDIYPNIMFSSLKKAKAAGLIITKKDKSSYPAKNIIYLTEKGRLVAEKFREINELLKGNE